VSRLFCATEGKRRDAAPLKRPKRPCRATTIDEIESMVPRGVVRYKDWEKEAE
jgi:hypothetical protein